MSSARAGIVAHALRCLLPAILLALPPAPVHAAGIPQAAPAGMATGTPRLQPVRLQTQPPDDFLELLRPQRTLVDIYYGGDLLLSTLAEYTPEHITFLQPEAIVERIPNPVSRLRLLEGLTGAQPRNSDLACRPRQSGDCGQLLPPVIGVIFDETRFRADVFVHPDMLLTSRQSLSQHLPAPSETTRPTLVQNLSAVYSNNDAAGTENYSLSGLTWAGYGMQRLYGRWYSTDYNAFSVEELAWQRDTHQHEYTAGIFQSRADSLSFTRTGFLAGAGVSRSLNTRTDLEHLVGSEISLFLPGRSQVDIYKDGRLVSSRIYAAGNQVIDTSRLPSGAYDIELRITDANGSVRTQRRFYSKSNRLAPRDTPLYFLEGGATVVPNRNTSLPEDDGTWVVRGGYQERLRDDIGWSAGGAATDNHGVAEGGLVWLRPAFELGGQAMLSSVGDRGWAGQASGRYGQLTGTLNYRRVWADPTLLPDEHWLVGGSQSQQYAVIGHPLGRGMAQASTERVRNSSGEIERHALRYLLPWQPGFMQSGTFSVEISRENGDLFAGVGIDLRSTARRSYAGLSVGWLHEDPAAGPTEDRATGSAVLGWRDDDRYAADIEVAGRITAERDATVAGLSGMHASEYGRLDATAEHIDTDSGISGNRVAATWDTNLVVGRKGLSWGGAQLAPAAVLLDLRGSAGGARFDVLVDERRVTTVSAGRRALLTLPPYATYRIRLVDRGSDFVAFDGSAQEVTLYPGTVASLQWNVQRVQIVLGRVVLVENRCLADGTGCSEQRSLLRNALVTGTHGMAMTDEDGRLQAELVEGTLRLQARRGDLACDMLLPAGSLVNGIRDLGELSCVPAQQDAPEGSRRQDPDPVAGQRLEARGTPAR